MTDLKNQIWKILIDSEEGIGPSQIGEMLKEDRRAVLYHLKKFTKDGKVESKDGKYWVKGREEIQKINEDILKALLDKDELEEKEIIKVLDPDYDNKTIKHSLLHLQSNDYLRSMSYSKKRGHYYSLTPLGCSKLGICHICDQKFETGDNLVANIRTEKNWQPVPLNQIEYISHLSCGKKLGRGFSNKDTCDYCGLPLSPKIIPPHKIKYNSILDGFYGIEIESIKIMEALYKRLVKPKNDFRDTPRVNEFAVTHGNNGISETYNKFQFTFSSKVPEWINKQIDAYNKEESKDINRGNLYIKIQPPFITVFEEIANTLFLDLSELSGAEKFMKTLVRYSSEFSNNYELQSRIKEIWALAKSLKEKDEQIIEGLYEKLLTPIGSVYSILQPIPSLESLPRNVYDPNTGLGKVRDFPDKLEDNSVSVSNAVIQLNKKKIYHPYCAKIYFRKNSKDVKKC